MRIIRVEEESDSRTLLWVAAGATVGLVAGALIAERLSGRKVSSRTLWRRARGLSGLAARRWTSLLGTAMALRDAWEARHDDEPGDAVDDAAGGDEEGLEAAPAATLDRDADDAWSGGDEDGDAEGFDDDGEEDEDRVDARVLEAFANDPILAERSVEIEEGDEGRITLHGRVHTAREVAHAVTLARGVPGVTAVRQRLSVRDRR